MKPFFASFALSLLTLSALPAFAETSREQNTVILDANTVANLHLKFASAEPREFEETAFALGRIEARPGATAAISSRIAGRVVGLNVQQGDNIAANAELVRVESRQAGDPPPTITLRAPLAGTVTALEVHLGDPVEPATALLEVTDLSEVDAVARVPETFAGALKLGVKARIRLTAFPGETFVGELVRLGTTADAATGTLAAHFRLPNSDGRLRPGLRAEFAIVTASRADVLSVPREAVQGEGTAPRVVFTKDLELATAFLKSPVVIGATNDQYVEIVSGLFPGDEVVTQGAYSLAFAGGGGVSLKEALDAAHGHEHAADGSELKPGAEGGHAHAAGEGDDHKNEPKGEAHEHGNEALPWQLATGALLLIAVILGVLLARRPAASTPASKEV